MASKNEDANYSPIQCQIYDYIEIACMRHYLLNIVLKSGDTINGTAITTKIKNQQEFIVINNKSNQEQAIRLDLVHSIQPLDENAEFGIVSIK